jgi:serine/threonine-protein kinase
MAGAPERLVDLVAARYGQLPAPARRVLQAIAIHGQVAARTRVAATLQAVDPAGGALAALVRDGLVIDDGRDLTIPFELVASVVVASTPADVRRQLAREALTDGGAAIPPGVRGALAEASGDLEAAIRGYLDAGEDAERRFDDPGSATWFGRAAATARRLQAEGHPRAEEWSVDAALRLADVLRYTGQLGLASGCLDEADQFQPSLRQQAGMARARGRIAITAGDLRAATRQLQKAIGLAFRTGDREFLCETYIDLAGALAQIGNTIAATAELYEAIDTITLGEGLDSSSAPSRLWLLGFRLAELHMRAGDLAAAERIARASLRQAERSGTTTGQGRLHALLASIVETAGQPLKALTHRAHALDHMRRLGDRRSTAELLIACARITGEITPAALPAGAPAGGAETQRKAMQLAHDLAKEIGWAEGVELTRASSG